MNLENSQTITDVDASSMTNAMLEAVSKNEHNLVIVFRQDQLGSGNRELGRGLIRPYLEALLRLPLPPQTFIFYNSAAYLVVKQSPVVNLLKELQNKGSEILVCNISLQHLGLISQMEVGEISTQEILLEKQLKADKILWP